MANNDDDDSVGYGRPPKHSRFPKGTSGNKKGRPKGSLNFKTEVEEELSERVPIRENGKERRISKRALITKVQVKKAIEGEDRAAKNIFNLIQSLGLAEPRATEAEILLPSDQALIEEFKRRTIEDAEAQKTMQANWPEKKDDE